MKPSLAMKGNMRNVMQVFGNYPMFSNLRIIGSLDRYEDTDDCDVDFYVDASNNATLFDIGDLIEELESLLEIPVDIKTSATQMTNRNNEFWLKNWEDFGIE